MSFLNRRKRARRSVPISETAPWTLYGSQRGKKGVKPLRPHSQPINSKLYIFLGDITELQVDSIVNAANNSLLGGGGVDGAIHAAAGPALRAECSKLGGCSTGDAKITKGHNLPSKHIVHTVGPRGMKPDVLRSCYSKCFELMREHDLKSIAFPCISTGIYGYPNQAAAEVAIETTRGFLEKNLEQVDAVIFCLFTNQDIEAYHKLLPAYFPLGPKDDAKDETESKVAEKEDGTSLEVIDSKREESGEWSDGDPNEGSGDPDEGSGINKSEAEVTTAEANVKDGPECDNGAKCQDVSETMSQEQSDPMSQEQSDPMSQEQSDPMSQEQSEPMSQEQSEPMSQEQPAATSRKDENEEPMSYQQEDETQDLKQENTPGTAQVEST